MKKNFEKILEIIKNPEYFLVNKYYELGVPKGFRIELFVARKFMLVSDSLKLLGHDYPILRCLPKAFCPYCEKLVVPKRHHKLDFGDLVLFIFTAGLWAIFLLVMHLFVRRCPACNYNLRGFRYLSENKQ